MNYQDTSIYAIESLADRALKVLQDPLCDPTSNKYKAVTTLLSKIDVFQNLFKCPVELAEFVQLISFHLDYEVHTYGSIIMKEQEKAKKFSILLRGNAQKLEQRPYLEVQNELVACKSNTSFPDIETQANFFHLSQEIIEETDSQDKESSSKRNNISTSIRIIDENGTPVSPQNVLAKADEINTDFKGLGEAYYRRPKHRRGCLKTTDYVSLGMLDDNKSNKSTQDGLSPKVGDNSPSSLSGTSLFGQTSLSKFKETFEAEDEVLLVPEVKNTEEENITKNMTQEHIQFVKDIAFKNPEIANRCLLGETIRLINTKTYGVGDYFGESTFKHHQSREKSMVVAFSAEVHLVSISRETYKVVMTEMLKRKNEKVQLFAHLFPSFDRELLREFSENFSQIKYKTAEPIYNQDDITDGLYIVQSGKVSLTKEFEVPNSITSKQASSSAILSASGDNKKAEIPLASIVKGQIFGEELLIDETFRQFTAVTATPNTIVYFLDASLFEEIKTKFEGFINILRLHAQEKVAWRNKRVNEFHGQRKFKLPLSETILPERLKNSGSTVVLKPYITFNKDGNPESHRKLTVIPSADTPSNTVQKSRLINSQVIIQEATPSAKNLDLYKEKFSRIPKTIQQKKGIEVNSPINMVGSFATKSNQGTFSEVVGEFNVRKELQKPKPAFKLPNLPSPNRNLSTAALREVECTRKSQQFDITPTESPNDIKQLKLRLTRFLSTSGFHGTPKMTDGTSRLKKILSSVHKPSGLTIN